MSSLVVLAPNGRRQTVKCTPNTTLLQVLEEVCKKQGFNAENYDIKHHNKVLDTTTTIRFSGLPNNAQLELCEIVKARLESDVTLAVNLESGKRIMGNFKPSDTLITVLLQTCPETMEEDKNPVVIYTRREIYGNELESTTLKSLGLTGGRAMIRVINRSPEELKYQANVSAPLPSKPVEEKPYRSQNLQRNESSSKDTKEYTEHVPKEIFNSEDKTNKSELFSESKPQKYQKPATVDILKLVKEKRKNTDNILVPEEKKKVDYKQKITKECECAEVEPMEVDCDLRCTKKCTNPIKSNSNEEEFIFLGNRNAMLFSLETANAIPSEDLPDDFFDLTIDDARKILKDVKNKRLEMENTPLLTSTLRNLEESKKQLRHLNKYKKSIIRIQFPDRTVLQGTFAPTESIEDVLSFVREYIEDKSLNFYVYTTPPKFILNKESLLIEIGCVPGALLYFGTHESEKRDHYLRTDLQNKFTSSSVASLAACKIREENTRPICSNMNDDNIDYEKNSQLMEYNDGASTSTGITEINENYERKIVKSTENVPKWFKPSK